MLKLLKRLLGRAEEWVSRAEAEMKIRRAECHGAIVGYVNCSQFFLMLHAETAENRASMIEARRKLAHSITQELKQCRNVVARSDAEQLIDSLLPNFDTDSAAEFIGQARH